MYAAYRVYKRKQETGLTLLTIVKKERPGFEPGSPDYKTGRIPLKGFNHYPTSPKKKSGLKRPG